MVGEVEKTSALVVTAKESSGFEKAKLMPTLCKDVAGTVNGSVRMSAGGETSFAEAVATLNGIGKTETIGSSGDATKESVWSVAIHVKAYVEEHGTMFDKPKNIDSYTYVFEGVALKDGFLVGAISMIVSTLVSLGTLANYDSVTIGETMSYGNAPFTGGSKEKSTVVPCEGTLMASTFRDNVSDSHEADVEAKEKACPTFAGISLEASKYVSACLGCIFVCVACGAL